MTTEALLYRQSNKIDTSYKPQLASTYHQLLVSRINDFNLGLDDDHEAGIKVFNGGQSLQFHLTGLMHADPSLISFSGATIQGSPIEIIQHISQVNIILVKLPRLEADKPKIVFEYTR